MANPDSTTPRSSPAAATPEAIVADATPEAIHAAATHIRAGRLVAFPTETVYGLGADATQDRAVARIFAAKGRPRFNPLIVHVANVADVATWAVMSPLAQRLADRFWPGPLTLVLMRREPCRLSLLVSAGLPTVAIRVPAHGVARDLLKAAGCPIAAPSANRSGRLSPTRADHVIAMLGDRVTLVLDGGPSSFGLESTVIDASGEHPRLLRPGALPTADIAAVVGRLEPGHDNAGAPVSPGRLPGHYAPRRPVRLEVTDARAGEALLAFGPDVPRGAAKTLNLSADSDLVEAAANFFAMLHELDDPRFEAIAVMPIPRHGLGEAINDRLTRAAHR